MTVRELPRLSLITDAGRVGEAALVRAVEAAGRAGLRFLQVREGALPPVEVRRLVAHLRPLLPRDAIVVASTTGRAADFARQVGADGAHVGGGDLNYLREVRRALPRSDWVGYSAHSAEEAAAAADAGADYVFLAPIFPTLSKESRREPLGIEKLAAACRAASVPVFALGGIAAARIGHVIEACAWGVAVIGSILDAKDPEAATRALLSGLGITAPASPSAGSPARPRPGGPSGS